MCKIGGKKAPPDFKFNTGRLANMLWSAGRKSGLPRGVGKLKNAKGEYTSGGGGRHGTVTCESPSVNVSGVVPFKLTINGFDYTCSERENDPSSIEPACDKFMYYSGVSKLMFTPTKINKNGNEFLRIVDTTNRVIPQILSYDKRNRYRLWIMCGGIRIQCFYSKMNNFIQCPMPQFPNTVKRLIVQFSFNNRDWHTLRGLPAEPMSEEHRN